MSKWPEPEPIKLEVRKSPMGNDIYRLIESKDSWVCSVSGDFFGDRVGEIEQIIDRGDTPVIKIDIGVL